MVLIAVAFGIAARRLTGSQRRAAEELVGVGFSCILVVLHWMIALVPPRNPSNVRDVQATRAERRVEFDPGSAAAPALGLWCSCSEPPPAANAGGDSVVALTSVPG